MPQVRQHSNQKLHATYCLAYSPHPLFGGTSQRSFL
jgi:alpha/beta superfamily hydrolase